MRYFLAFIILQYVILSSVFSQTTLGEWRDHLRYNNVFHIIKSEDKIICAAPAGLFTYDLTDNSLNKISKINGLSDIRLSAAGYDEDNGVLLVGYENGNIDVLQQGETFNISDFKSKIITGDKAILHVEIVYPYAYLSCGLGILQVNLEKKEIGDAYYFGNQGSFIKVYGTTTLGNTIWAATEDGLYRADLDDPFLINYQNWDRYDVMGNTGGVYNSITRFGTDIVVNKSNAIDIKDSVFLIQPGSTEIFFTDNFTNHSVFGYEGMLTIASYEKVSIFNSSGIGIDEFSDYDFYTFEPVLGLKDLNGNIWLADHTFGLVKYEPSRVQSIHPNGPLTDAVYSLDIGGDKVYMVPGGKNASLNNLYLNGALFSFMENVWNSSFYYDVSDFCEVLVNPANSNEVYVGSWNYGVLKYENGELTEHFDAQNSTLQSAIPGEKYVRIGGITMDREGNLWVVNTGVENPVSVRLADGSWKSFPYQDAMDSYWSGNMAIDPYDQKWVLLPKGKGLFVFNENKTYDNHGDDFKRQIDLFEEDDGKVYPLSNEVFSIAVDKEGFVWVGTSEGPVVYYTPDRVFEEETVYFNRVKKPNEIEGEASYLLDGQIITSIAIDGADRKWFGTDKSGIYLISKDGSKQIAHFTTQNSPLISDRITKIAINHKNGEVFIGTDKGLVSYRGDATAGNDDFTDVYVFPNPVREDYHGPVTIAGLVENTIVKITDVSGNLVYEGKSLGGQAVWDGKNFQGRRVQTGVYLVFCATEDGTKSIVTKLLFIH